MFSKVFQLFKNMSKCILLFQDTSTESSKNTEQIGVNVPQKDILKPQLFYHGTLYPLSFDPYFSYAYSNEFLHPTLPYYQHPVFVNSNHFENKKNSKGQLNPAINFKRDPEIPDVIPPLLPIKDERVNSM